VQQLRELAERTPARRVRHVDLLRAVAIVTVIVGHWLVIAIEDKEGLRRFSALQHLSHIACQQRNSGQRTSPVHLQWE
jgi:peptidoglycan/LPS O-acetylase OafA/YrhL